MDAYFVSNASTSVNPMPQTPPPTAPTEWLPLFSHHPGKFVSSEVWQDENVRGVRFKVHAHFRMDAVHQAVALLKRFGRPMQSIVLGETVQPQELDQQAAKDMPEDEFQDFASRFPPLYIHCTDSKEGYRPIGDTAFDLDDIEGTSLATVPSGAAAISLPEHLLYTIFVKHALDHCDSSKDRDNQILYMSARTLAHEVIHSWRLSMALRQLPPGTLRLDWDGDVEVHSTVFEKIGTPPRGAPFKVHPTPHGVVLGSEAGRQWENAISQGMCTLDETKLIFALQDQEKKYRSLRLTAAQISAILEDPEKLLDLTRTCLPPETSSAQIRRYASHSGLLPKQFVGCPGFVPLFESRFASLAWPPDCVNPPGQ